MGPRLRGDDEVGRGDDEVGRGDDEVGCEVTTPRTRSRDAKNNMRRQPGSPQKLCQTLGYPLGVCHGDEAPIGIHDVDRRGVAHGIIPSARS